MCLLWTPLKCSDMTRVIHGSQVYLLPNTNLTCRYSPATEHAVTPIGWHSFPIPLRTVGWVSLSTQRVISLLKVAYNWTRVCIKPTNPEVRVYTTQTSQNQLIFCDDVDFFDFVRHRHFTERLSSYRRRQPCRRPESFRDGQRRQPIITTITCPTGRTYYTQLTCH